MNRVGISPNQIHVRGIVIKKEGFNPKTLQVAMKILSSTGLKTSKGKSPGTITPLLVNQKGQSYSAAFVTKQEGQPDGIAAPTRVQSVSNRTWHSLDFSQGGLVVWLPAMEGDRVSETRVKQCHSYNDFKNEFVKVVQALMAEDKEAKSTDSSISIPLPEPVVITDGDPSQAHPLTPFPPLKTKPESSDDSETSTDGDPTQEQTPAPAPLPRPVDIDLPPQPALPEPMKSSRTSSKSYGIPLALGLSLLAVGAILYRHRAGVQVGWNRHFQPRVDQAQAWLGQNYHNFVNRV